MPDRKLYGRDSFVSETVKKISSTKKPVVLIQGPTGVGKTDVAREIAKKLELDHDAIIVFYTVEGRLQAYEEPFLRFLRKIVALLPATELTAKKIIDAVSVNPENKLAKIISALYQDATKKLSIEKTMESLGTIFTEAVDGLIEQANKLARQERDSFYTEYMDALRAIAPNLAKKAVLIIDQLEAASEPMLEFLKSFSKNKPPNVAFLIIVNNETAEGVACINSIKPVMQRIGVELLDLPGITEKDLMQWVKEEKHFPLSKEIAIKAVIELGGRPLLLQSWIDLGEFSLRSLDKPGLNMWGYYEELFFKLTPDAQSLAISLSPLSLALPIDSALISKICNKPEESVLPLLQELERYKFIEKWEGRYRYAHQLLRKFILEKMTPPAGLMQKILSVLEEKFGRIETNAQNLPLIEAKIELLPAIKGRESFEFSCPLAKRQLEEGSYNSALTISDMALAMLSEQELTMDDQARVCLVKAKVLDQLGEYENGIKELSKIDDSLKSKELQAQILTLRGELFLRWNKYEESLKHLSAAEEILIKINNIESLSQVYIRKGDLLRDTEKYEDALLLAKKLKEEILPFVTNELQKAHIHRSISRAFSALNEPDAIYEAYLSEKIAAIRESKRDLGNACFTVGEAYRSIQLYADAIAAYNAGLNIADSLGNKDLQIYCYLGLAAAHLPLQELSEVGYDIVNIRKLESTKFPVESLHVKLIQYAIKLLRNEDVAIEDIDSLDAEYIQLSRRWPGKFLKELKSEADVQRRIILLKTNPIKL